MIFRFDLESFETFVGNALAEHEDMKGRYSVELALLKDEDSGEIVGIEVTLEPMGDPN